MRWVPEVLTDQPGGAPRGPAMGITGRQGPFNQRVRLPGNKKSTHSSRSPCPMPLQSQSRGPALRGSQPTSQLLGREAGLLVRTPEGHGT